MEVLAADLAELTALTQSTSVLNTQCRLYKLLLKADLPFSLCHLSSSSSSLQRASTSASAMLRGSGRVMDAIRSPMAHVTKVSLWRVSATDVEPSPTSLVRSTKVSGAMASNMARALTGGPMAVWRWAYTRMSKVWARDACGAPRYFWASAVSSARLRAARTSTFGAPDDGRYVEEVSLEEARRIADNIGEAVPVSPAKLASARGA